MKENLDPYIAFLIGFAVHMSMNVAVHPQVEAVMRTALLNPGSATAIAFFFIGCSTYNHHLVLKKIQPDQHREVTKKAIFLDSVSLMTGMLISPIGLGLYTSRSLAVRRNKRLSDLHSSTPQSENSNGKINFLE